LASHWLRKACSASCESDLWAVAEEWALTVPVEPWTLAGSEGTALVLAEAVVSTGRLVARRGGLPSGAAGKTACQKFPFAAWDQVSMHFDDKLRSAGRKGMAGVAARAGGGGWAKEHEGAAAEWLVTRGGAWVAVVAGGSVATSDAADVAGWSAEVAAALGVAMAVGHVWAGGGGGAGMWPGVVRMSRWCLANARAPSSAVQ